MEHLASSLSYYKWLAVTVGELTIAANKRMSLMDLERKKLSAQKIWRPKLKLGYGGLSPLDPLGDATIIFVTPQSPRPPLILITVLSILTNRFSQVTNDL